MNSVFILGCRVDSVSWQDIDTSCVSALKESKPFHIVTLNGEQILLAQNNQAYQTALLSADLVIPDSTNVIWVSRWLGRGLQQATPGSDLTVRLAKLAAENDRSLFLLGANEGVAAAAATELQRLYPKLKIAGTSSADPDDSTVIADIARSKADIVLIAYGAPTHDLWIHKNKGATGAKILVGIGGTFDMLAGRLPRAPQWMRTLHLEWLWRLILQPTRIGRIWNAVVVFPVRAILSD